MLLSLLLLSLLVSLWHAKMQLNVLKGHHHIPLSFRCYWGVGWLFACLKDVAPVSDNWLTWRLLFPSGWWQRRFLLPFFRWTADNIPGEVSWYLTVLRLLPVLLLMLLFIKESCLFYLMATLARERRSTTSLFSPVRQYQGGCRMPLYDERGISVSATPSFN